MMRLWSCDAPWTWPPSPKRSRPSTRRPRRVANQAAALPSPPRPTITMSASNLDERSATAVHLLAHDPPVPAADVGRVVLHRREPAPLGSEGPHAPLHALADAPVLAVHEVPELQRVGRIEARRGQLVRREQEVADHRGV